jgi:hypothetical protein
VAGSPVANPVPADALAQAGITVSLAAVTELPDGVVAPALRITYRTSDGSSLNYELGSASATIQGTASGATSPPAAGESGAGGNAAWSPAPVVTEPAPDGAPLTVDVGPIELPADMMSPVSAAGVDAGATPMWLDTPSGATAAARALLPTGPETSPVAAAGSAPVTTALVAPSRRVGSITRISLLTHLINGGNLEPLFGVALILVAAGSALLLAGIRRASVR